MTGAAKQLHIRCNPKTVSKQAPRCTATGRGAFVAAPKLDTETARKIEAEAKRWRHEVVARRFGVSLKTVSSIVNGRTHATA